MFFPLAVFMAEKHFVGMARAVKYLNFIISAQEIVLPKKQCRKRTQAEPANGDEQVFLGFEIIFIQRPSTIAIRAADVDLIADFHLMESRCQFTSAAHAKFKVFFFWILAGSKRRFAKTRKR